MALQYNFGNSGNITSLGEVMSRVGGFGFNKQAARLAEEEDKAKAEAERAAEKQYRSGRDTILDTRANEAAKALAQQNEWDMLIKSAKMGTDADYQQATLGLTEKQIQAAAEESKRNAAHRASMMDLSNKQFELLNTKYTDEKQQNKDNISLFNDISGVRKEVPRNVVEGVNSPLSQFNRMAERITPEQSALLGPAGARAMQLQAELAAKRDVEGIKNLVYNEQIANILTRSNADVGTRKTLGDMIKSNKPEPTAEAKNREEIMTKYGIDTNTQEGKSFLADIRKKAIHTSWYTEDKKANSEYLLKSMTPLTANDDPEESNRKLIEMMPDLEQYAKDKGISFKQAVEDLKVSTSKSQGLMSVWDQDVERGGTALLGKNY